MWKTSGWAYSNDGEIHLGAVFAHCVYKSYTQGDVVGCGIDNLKQLFFTKNGKKLGKKLPPLPAKEFKGGAN